MTKWRVYIATTEGPTEIQGIIEEDRDLQSVICLDGTANALPVSTGYDAFVRKPTGVVERITGNRVYRMDVSHPITNGNSWQLGVYVGHMLAHSDELARKGEGARGIILATGALRTRDLHLDSVGHVKEKLEAAETLINSDKIIFLLPVDDYEALSPDFLAGYKDRVTFIPLSDAEDILTKLSGNEMITRAKNIIPIPEPVSVPVLPARVPASGKKVLIGLVFLGAILVGTGGYIVSQWQMGLGLEKELARMTRNGNYADLIELKDHSVFDGLAGKIADYFFPISKSADILSYEISLVQPSDDKSCAGMRFRDAKSDIITVLPTSGSNNFFKVPNKDNLCAFEISLRNNGSADLEILSLVKPSMLFGRFLSSDEGGQVESYKLPAHSNRTIEIKLPLYRNNKLDYNIWAIGSPKESRQLYDMLAAEARSDNSLTFNWDSLREVGVNIIEVQISIGD